MHRILMNATVQEMVIYNFKTEIIFFVMTVYWQEIKTLLLIDTCPNQMHLQEYFLSPSIPTKVYSNIHPLGRSVIL